MGRLLIIVFLGLFITSFCIIGFVCTIQKSKKVSEENEEDKTEWRILEKDEQVPRGSHVQLDLTTGEHRIKIISSEKNDKEKKTSIMQLNSDVETSPENSNFRLRHIGEDSKLSGNSDDEKKNAAKHKFKSYEELKKDFEDLRMAVKTDIEIMNSILESYKELLNDKMPATAEIQQQQITMLTDLEYLLHQIDNANEFVKNGGLTNIILPSLNSSSSEVRTRTARVLGSAAQSNVAVQIVALESGAVGILLRILTLDKTPSVRSSTMYALSCLVRRFPIAQKKFVDDGGLTVLNNLFNSDGPDRLKIQVKVLSLIHDLIVEKQDAEKAFTLISKDTNNNASAASISEAKERLRQYNLISLETKLQEQQWCTQLSSLLFDHVSLQLDVIVADINLESSSISEQVNIEHDVVEKIIKAMISSSNLCLSDYENNYQLKEIIHVLQLWYKKLFELEEDSDSYFKHMLQMLDYLSWKYKIHFKGNLKDEL